MSSMSKHSINKIDEKYLDDLLFGLQDSKIRICATDAKSHDIENMVDVVRLWISFLLHTFKL